MSGPEVIRTFSVSNTQALTIAMRDSSISFEPDLPTNQVTRTRSVEMGFCSTVYSVHNKIQRQD